jgi:hypothetical protein
VIVSIEWRFIVLSRLSDELAKNPSRYRQDMTYGLVPVQHNRTVVIRGQTWVYNMA